MKTLQESQSKFIESIYGKPKAEILQSIKSGKAPKKELLDIYRNNLYCSLTSALEITYPKVFELSGNNKFKEFCQEFIKANKSNSGNLDDYGANFAKFLKGKGELLFHDLAISEWLMHQSYLAQDSDPVNIKSLQKLNPEKLFDVKFELNPSCFLLESNYNLLNKNKGKKLKKPVYFAIYRHNLDVEIEKISKEDFVFLSGVKSNLTLYEIYEKYEIDIQSPLQKYLTNSVLINFKL